MTRKDGTLTYNDRTVKVVAASEQQPLFGGTDETPIRCVLLREPEGFSTAIHWPEMPPPTLTGYRFHGMNQMKALACFLQDCDEMRLKPLACAHCIFGNHEQLLRQDEHCSCPCHVTSE